MYAPLLCVCQVLSNVWVTGHCRAVSHRITGRLIKTDFWAPPTPEFQTLGQSLILVYLKSYQRMLKHWSRNNHVWIASVLEKFSIDFTFLSTLH